MALQRPAFYALVLFGGYLTYLVLSPFLVGLAWAVLLAILFWSTQVRLSARIGPNRAALATTVLAGLLIVAPAAMLVSTLAREAPQVTDYLRQQSLSASPRIERMWETARSRSPVPLPADPIRFLTDSAGRAFTFLAPRAGAILADVVSTLGTLFAMLFALFFMLRDGDAMGRQVRDLMPVPEHEKDGLIRETRDLVVASIGAGLLVAAAQGVVGGVAFWLLGLSAPLFWGVVLAFCSLVPVVGAALVWVPAALGLLLVGEVGRGVAMLIVGALGISMVDNVLRPLFMSGRTQVSGLVIFFGLLGGAAAFGFIGLVIGPIILVTTGRLLSMLLGPGTEDDPR